MVYKWSSKLFINLQWFIHLTLRWFMKIDDHCQKGMPYVSICSDKHHSSSTPKSTFSRGRCECPLRALPARSTIGRQPHGALRCGCSFISSGRAVPAGLCRAGAGAEAFLTCNRCKRLEVWDLYAKKHVNTCVTQRFYQFWWRCALVLQQLFNRKLFFQGIFCVEMPLIQVRYQMISMSLTVCTMWWHFCLI